MFILIILGSCTNKNSEQKLPESNNEITATSQSITLKDTTVQFLWRENIYDNMYKDSISSIIINEQYCEVIPDQVKAAIAYVATFIGNECWWEGEAKEDRSNLKCKILTALDLGCQGSEQHLGFLRKWFSNDKKALEELESVPTTPFTSTIQDTFDKITVTIKGNEIIVWYSAHGFNTRENESWSWTETNHFEFDKSRIVLKQKDAQ